MCGKRCGGDTFSGVVVVDDDDRSPSRLLVVEPRDELRPPIVPVAVVGVVGIEVAGPPGMGRVEMGGDTIFRLR